MLRHWFCAALLVGVWAGAVLGQDPKLIYVTGETGNPEIVLLKPEDAIEVLGGHAASDIFPSWSRNGENIAFASNRSGKFQIHTMDALGAGGKQLTLERDGDSVCPSWSPTGDRIVYQHGFHHDWDLWVITADGETWQRIVRHAWQPDWSPPREKGDRIAFVSDKHDAGLFIWTCEPNGTNIRAIHKLKNTIGKVFPIWSRDASRIAFTDKIGKSHEIFTCSPEGGDVRAMTNLGRKNIFPHWSTDNKQIYFLHERADHLWQWMSVEVETGEIAVFETIKAEPFIRGMRGSWY